MSHGSAYTTLLNIVQALAGHTQEELWLPLLQSAVEVVPKAQGGSILTRQGHAYRMLASYGFPLSSINLDFPEAAVLAWFGNPEQWAAGMPRIAQGEELYERNLHRSNSPLKVGSAGEQHIFSVRSNICLPIKLGESIAAFISLDNYDDPQAFDEAALEAAKLYSLQATALLAAQSKRAELETRLHQFEVIERLSQTLQTATDLPTIAHKLATEASSLMDSPHTEVLLINEGGDALTAVASRGLFAFFLEDSKVPKGKGLSWVSLDSGQVVYTYDSLQDPRTHNPRPDLHSPHSQLTAPLLDSAGQPLGVLHVARDLPRQFTQQEIRTMEVIASVSSTALERARVIAHLVEQKSEREAAFEGALRAIGVALEARDLETAGHTDRVATLAHEVGKELGLESESLQELRWGSFLHDIGKLAIPDQILLKPGLLDSRERAIMQTHCELGYRFTLGLPFLPEASRQVIRYHQERWNGQGYPEGLSKNTIPLLARIFSVCDVFDALISPRPYKLTWRIRDALLEVANQAGLQFDPQVVSAFLRVIRRNPKVLRDDLSSNAES